MGEQITQKVLHFPTNDEKVRKRAGAIVRIVFDKFPDMEEELRQKAIREGRKEGVKQGVKRGVKRGTLKTLEHLFTRRLNRPLTSDEHTTLAQRIDTHGADRLSDVALDLSAKRLAAWLANPDAE